jgi:hypothetical protein
VTHILLEFVSHGGVGGREEAMARFAADVMAHA